AASETLVPCPNCAEQVEPQSIPPGLLVTVPDPVPAFETDSVRCPSKKIAVTDLAPSMTTVQVVPIAEQSPLQAAKVEFAPALAVSVTCVPCANCAEHVEPQSIPPGLLVTVPDPFPTLETDRVCRIGVNVAVTDMSLSMNTLQAPVPEQAPLQP